MYSLSSWTYDIIIPYYATLQKNLATSGQHTATDPPPPTPHRRESIAMQRTSLQAKKEETYICGPQHRGVKMKKKLV